MARDKEQENVEKTPKGNKRGMIIVVAVVASVALIAGGVMYFMNSQKVVTAAETGSDKKMETGKKKAVPVIYSLEPFIVNIRDGSDMRYLKLKVELDVNAEKEMKAELDPYLAPLRDAILVLLTSKSLQDIQDLPGKNRLRDDILATASKILPPGKVNRVYFTDFVVQ